MSYVLDDEEDSAEDRELIKLERNMNVPFLETNEEEEQAGVWHHIPERGKVRDN